MSTAFRVGIFIFLALVCLSVGVFLIGSKDFLFGSGYRLQTDFRNAGGLNNGADVRVGGIHEGTVKEIVLPSQSDGNVTVVMTLRQGTSQIIKKDSVASIETEGLLGDKYIEISFGSTKAQPVHNGDTIAGAVPQDVATAAQAVAGEAEQATAAVRDDAQALQHNFLLRGFFNKRGYNDPGELTAHAIPRLPQGRPAKEFDFEASELFGKADSAALRSRKSLDEAGTYLQENRFGIAVVACSEARGDTQNDKVLSEARAKAIRDYLVQNFKLDDTHLKTIGLGKAKDADTSKIAILIYAAAPAEAPD